MKWNKWEHLAVANGWVSLQNNCGNHSLIMRYRRQLMWWPPRMFVIGQMCKFVGFIVDRLIDNLGIFAKFYCLLSIIWKVSNNEKNLVLVDQECVWINLTKLHQSILFMNCCNLNHIPLKSAPDDRRGIKVPSTCSEEGISIVLLGLVRAAFTCLDATTTSGLFTTMVRPHLEYGNVIWYIDVLRWRYTNTTQSDQASSYQTLKV